MSILNLVANGNISPCRFAAIDPSENHKAIQANATAVPVGVTQVGTDWPPINDPHVDQTAISYAAIDGEPIRIFAQGESCLLQLGADCVAGDRLKPDADGKGTPVKTDGTVTVPQNYGARAETAGSAGEFVRVHVDPGTYTYAA